MLGAGLMWGVRGYAELLGGMLARVGMLFCSTPGVNLRMWISGAYPPGFPPSCSGLRTGLQTAPAGFIVAITRKAT